MTDSTFNSLLNNIFSKRAILSLIENKSNYYYVKAVQRYVENPETKTNLQLISEIYAKIKTDHKNEYYYKNTVLNQLLVGKISSKIQDKDSESLYKDIESCLIYDNKPLANTQCKDSYNGRQIKIENQGVYCSLKKFSDSSKFLKKSAESYFGY